MKTKVIILAIATFLVATTVKANYSKSEVIDNIKKELNYPHKAIEQGMEGDVYVAFKLDDNGKVIVSQANSADEDLKKIVVEEIESLNPRKLGIAKNEIYCMKVSLKIRS